VKDGVELVAQSVVRPGAEPQARQLKICRHGSDTATRDIVWREQCRQHGAQAGARSRVVRGADERDDRALGALHETQEQFHAEKSGGAGEENRSVIHAAAPIA